MQIYVDQSQKVEQTNKDTILGLSNSKIYTVSIPSPVKRKLQKGFRLLNKPRLFVYRTFIAGVVLLLKHSELKLKQSDTLIIDVEYHGKGNLLRSIFLEMYSMVFREIPEISFRRIGRKSPAHEISYLTATTNRSPDCILKYGELKRLALK